MTNHVIRMQQMRNRNVNYRTITKRQLENYHKMATEQQLEIIQFVSNRLNDIPNKNKHGRNTLIKLNEIEHILRKAREINHSTRVLLESLYNEVESNSEAFTSTDYVASITLRFKDFISRTRSKVQFLASKLLQIVKKYSIFRRDRTWREQYENTRLPSDSINNT